MMLNVRFYAQFKKDLKTAKKRHLDMDKLKNVIEMLRRQESLPPKYCDHALKGKYAGYRECHIMPDWLLVYKVDEGMLLLVLARTGSHSDLF